MKEKIHRLSGCPRAERILQNDPRVADQPFR